jgi:hypothetical protein
MIGILQQGRQQQKRVDSIFFHDGHPFRFFSRLIGFPPRRDYPFPVQG